MLNGALPTWDMDPLRLVLALSRGLWLACLFSGAGALLFRALEPDGQGAAEAYVARLIRRSLVAAMLAWLVWVLVQARVLAGPAPGQWLPVLWHTWFGRTALAQLALVALARLSAGGPRILPTLFAFAAVAVEVTHLHSWAMESTPGVLVASVLVHVLAAAAWLGGLLPLRIVVRYGGPAQAAATVERFSDRGVWLVLLLGGSAFTQGRTLLGGIAGIAGTAYGWMAMGKLALFVVLLALAARNRWRLMPALGGGDTWAAQRSLERSIALETVAGLLIVLAAALLSALQPGMHAQPVWPFTMQPNFAALATPTPDSRWALLAVGACALALAVVGLSVLSRPLRWPLLAFAAALGWFGVPRLSLWLVPAMPTSFYHSTSGFAATGIAEGAALYAEHCAGCHGAEGHGDGKDAAKLPLRPADLNGPALWQRSDGVLFARLTDGMAAPDGVPAMPGFAATLSEDDRWYLIDFLRARNAGLAHAAGGAWPAALLAPDLDADCADGRHVSLSDLRGKPVRLAFQAAAGDKLRPPPTAAGPVLTIFVPRPDASEAAGGDCIAADPSVTAVYALVTGLKPDLLAGADVLIAADGRLQAVRPADPPPVAQHSEEQPPMRHVLLTAALLAAPAAAVTVAAPAAPAMAADMAMIDVAQPWAPATPGHAGTAAVYLTLTDHGPDDVLTGASTPAASMTMLHATKMENGVAKMVMLDSVPLPPHTAVVFKPGQMHIMLTGLKAPLVAGSSFPLTLTFAHAKPMTVTVTVLPPGSAGPDAAGGKMDDMQGMKMD